MKWFHTEGLRRYTVKHYEKNIPMQYIEDVQVFWSEYEFYFIELSEFFFIFYECQRHE